MRWELSLFFYREKMENIPKIIAYKLLKNSHEVYTSHIFLCYNTQAYQMEGGQNP